MTKKEILTLAREAAAAASQNKKPKKEIIEGLRDDTPIMRGAIQAVLLTLAQRVHLGDPADKAQPAIDPRLLKAREIAAEKSPDIAGGILRGEFDDFIAAVLESLPA